VLRITACSSMLLVTLSHFLCTGSHAPLQDTRDRLISMSRIAHTCSAASWPYFLKDVATSCVLYRCNLFFNLFLNSPISIGTQSLTQQSPFFKYPPPIAS
jgi:hypothetical protein